MLRKTVSGIMLTLLLIGMLTSTLVKFVKTESSIELSYDDGGFEWFVSAELAKFAVNFSLPIGWSNARLITARFCLDDAMIFRLHIYDEAGITDLIPPIDVPSPSNGWYDVDLSGLHVIVPQNFMIAKENIVEHYVPPYVGEDTSSPISNRSFYRLSGQSGWVLGTCNYAIRAVVMPTVDDVAVINLVHSKTGCLPMPTVGQNYNLSICVTVENQGDFEETFNLTAYANTTVIDELQVTLTFGENKTLTFTWNTTGFAYGNYTIWAYAWPVQNETDEEDNTLIGGTVLVSIAGDVNGDHLVDISDLVITVGAIPSSPTINPENWNPNTDINSDGVCDISDLVICVGNIPSGPW